MEYYAAYWAMAMSAVVLCKRRFQSKYSRILNKEHLWTSLMLFSEYININVATVFSYRMYS